MPDPITEPTQDPEPIVLPYERRYEQISYQDDEGTVGCVAFPVNYGQLYNLKGRLLTLIDATYTDPQQRKAQKDIVWQTLQQWMRDIAEEGETCRSPHPIDSDAGSEIAA